MYYAGIVHFADAYMQKQFLGGGTDDKLISRRIDKGLSEFESMARYEAMFGGELERVWDKAVGQEAVAQVDLFKKQNHNIGANDRQLNIWRTTPMVQVDSATLSAGRISQLANIDHIEIPEPILAIFKDLIGDDLSRVAHILLAPAQKFTFNPPQLHTMVDLPAEEWYSFDWIGMIDAIEASESLIIEIKNHASKYRQSAYGDEYIANCTIPPYDELKEKLAEILPDTPSPKNIKEAFFWSELRATGLTPYEYFILAANWAGDKMYADIYASLGVDYYEAIRSGNVDILYEIMHQPQNSAIFADQEESFEAIVDLGLGVHWTAKDADLSSANGIYADAVTKIRSDPDYDKAFDQSISYDEREAVRIELDKKMRAMIDANWQYFLEAFKNSILMQNPLKSLLQVV